MSKTYASQGKSSVFPSILESLPDSQLTIADLVEVYRNHTPSIGLFAGYPTLLPTLAKQHRLGVITDGLPSVQMRKVSALKLEGVIDKIIYTWEFGADKEKPHPFSFALMLEHLQVSPESALYIGDNPDKDCKGAHGAGMKYAQIRGSKADPSHSGESADETPEFTIDTLLQLPQVLQHLN